MSTCKLTVRSATTIPLEVPGLLPAAVANRSALEVAKLPVQYGNRQECAGEFFDITRSTREPVGADLHFAGETSHVQGIGANMSGGVIRVENDVGRHAGARMSGGRLLVGGGAGDWLGAEMTGGQIDIRGSAGHQVGAAYRGSRRGMRGGRIVIRGDAGDEVGLLMRRGFVAIRGNCGTFAGASMIAGTLFVFGALGARAGAGMTRGTIAAFGATAPLPPGFRETCEYEPLFLQRYLQELRQTGLDVPPHLFDPAMRYLCSRGDRMTGGRGEVFRLLRTMTAV